LNFITPTLKQSSELTIEEIIAGVTYAVDSPIESTSRECSAIVQSALKLAKKPITTLISTSYPKHAPLPPISTAPTKGGKASKPSKPVSKKSENPEGSAGNDGTEGDDGVEDDRSFLAKHWYYIIPLIVVALMGGGQPEQPQAQPKPQVSDSAEESDEEPSADADSDAKPAESMQRHSKAPSSKNKR
jgi:hypothetical protein